MQTEAMHDFMGKSVKIYHKFVVFDTPPNAHQEGPRC